MGHTSRESYFTRVEFRARTVRMATIALHALKEAETSSTRALNLRLFRGKPGLCRRPRVQYHLIQNIQTRSKKSDLPISYQVPGSPSHTILPQYIDSSVSLIWLARSYQYWRCYCSLLHQAAATFANLNTSIFEFILAISKCSLVRICNVQYMKSGLKHLRTHLKVR